MILGSVDADKYNETMLHGLLDVIGEFKPPFLDIILACFPKDVRALNQNVREISVFRFPIVPWSNSSQRLNFLQRIHIVWREASGQEELPVWGLLSDPTGRGAGE